ncbi:MAG: 23S rRNA (guanosine(2251)-2'-O)-methyltransferase RlmB [Saprospiraceae bacterium]
MSQVIFGKNPVLEAFSSKQSIEKVYILATLRGELEIKIRHLCKEHNIPLAKVPEMKLGELSKKKLHQGLVAIISPVKYIDFEKMMDETIEKNGCLVVLDNVTDVRNMGAIARSCYYFGVSGLVLSGNYSGQINEDTVKTSAGSILNLPLSRVNSLLSSIADLQNKGFQVVATDVKGTKKTNEIDFTLPTAIIMGAEEKGLHYKVLESADATVTIEGKGNFDSLNVSVATGILLYEVGRQRAS